MYCNETNTEKKKEKNNEINIEKKVLYQNVHSQLSVYLLQLGKQDKVRALLAAGADPCVPNAEGKLPLDGAPDKMRTIFNEELLQATAQSK